MRVTRDRARLVLRDTVIEIVGMAGIIAAVGAA
jgi:hypothetical protein